MQDECKENKCNKCELLDLAAWYIAYCIAANEIENPPATKELPDLQTPDFAPDELVKCQLAKTGVRSLLTWRGGKFLLAKKIIPLMPLHACYVEPFCGAAHVLFKKTPSPIEVINDIDSELINFWRTVRDNIEELKYEHKWAFYSRQQFNEYKKMTPSELAAKPAWWRGWRFFYLNRLCMAGIMRQDIIKKEHVQTTSQASSPAHANKLNNSDNECELQIKEKESSAGYNFGTSAKEAKHNKGANFRNLQGNESELQDYESKGISCSYGIQAEESQHPGTPKHHNFRNFSGNEQELNELANENECQQGITCGFGIDVNTDHGGKIRVYRNLQGGEIIAGFGTVVTDDHFLPQTYSNLQGNESEYQQTEHSCNCHFAVNPAKGPHGVADRQCAFRNLQGNENEIQQQTDSEIACMFGTDLKRRHGGNCKSYRNLQGNADELNEITNANELQNTGNESESKNIANANESQQISSAGEIACRFEAEVKGAGARRTVYCNMSGNENVMQVLGKNNAQFATQTTRHGEVSAYGGLRQGLGAKPDSGKGKKRIADAFTPASCRLSRVVIENLDWENCIRRYDRPTTFFYLDPPYFGKEEEYGKGKFARDDFYRLADMLANIKGKFLLSIGDCPEARECFARFNLLADIPFQYSRQNAKGFKPVGELLYGNYLPETLLQK